MLMEKRPLGRWHNIGKNYSIYSQSGAVGSKTLNYWAQKGKTRSMKVNPVIYKDNNAFNTGTSLGREIQAPNFSYLIKKPNRIAYFFTRQNGFYLDMNNERYKVDNFYIIGRENINFSDLPAGHVPAAREFFETGKLFYVKFSGD